MKRGWMIVLLLSLGINVGLGLSLLRRAPEEPPLPAMAPLAGEEPDPAQVDGFMRRRLDRMADRLQLDEAQRAALWTLQRDVGHEVFERRRGMLAARADLHRAYADSQADAAVIHRALRQVSDTQAALDSLVVEVMLREREILRPEQRQRYQRLFPMGPGQHQHHDAPGPRRGPRHGRGERQ